VADASENTQLSQESGCVFGSIRGLNGTAAPDPGAEPESVFEKAEPPDQAAIGVRRGRPGRGRSARPAIPWAA